ncbi:suppressor of fused domain protein [Hoyosella sp. YIM 151337]|uniref:suppressor of fused domain protein n=1 Tax=Hoyosella sp. YIM 151337 TaxID=2992742 RepID=UPI002235E988|nr:suppressor of fused domain protein [Hoyosella sp. YIM 151337]MCW4355130.1 suppressor of fused domain protein [Hoyosella sp. YIM 151337]
MALRDIPARVRAHVTTELNLGDPVAASVTFLGVEPIEVLRYGPAGGDPQGLVYYVTSGCSQHPMGDPADLMADPVRGPRAEILMRLRGGVDQVLRPLAVLAASPSVDGLVLAADSLVDLSEPLWPGSAFTAVVLGPCDIAPLTLSEPMSAVEFFEAVPVTATEAAWVRLRGVAALREAWKEASIDTADPARSAVRMS